MTIKKLLNYSLISIFFFAACEKSCFDSSSTQMQYEYKLLQKEAKSKNDQRK